MTFTAAAILGILALLFILLNARMLRFVPESRTLVWAFVSLLLGIGLELIDDPIAARMPAEGAFAPLRLALVYSDLLFFNGYCFFTALWCRRLVRRSGHAAR